jgi:hypothetical protein
MITLSQSALTGLRTFADAATGGALTDGDVVGVLVRATGDPERWIVGEGTYAASSGTIGLTAIEDTATESIEDGAGVDVQAVVTGSMLRALDARFAPSAPESFDGPGYWDIGSPAATSWDADNGWYTHVNYYTHDNLSDAELNVTASGASAGWHIGYRPTNLSVEVYIPAGASMDNEHAKLAVYYNDGNDYIDGDFIGSGYAVGDVWVTLTCPNLATDLSGDISAVQVRGLASAFEEESSTFRIRNLVFTE